MELKDQVISLELTKQLKELGVPQDSQFYWVKGMEVSDYPRGGEYEGWFDKNNEQLVGRDAGLQLIQNIKDGLEDDDDWKDVFVYSALTSSEIGEILPTYTSMLLQVTKTDYHWLVNISGSYFSSHSKNLAEAMGLMLIYLLTNKLLKLK